MNIQTQVGWNPIDWVQEKSGDMWSWMRKLPGYDALSDAGGVVFAAYTDGIITPEMQKSLNNYLVRVSDATGKAVASLTVQDVQKFAEEETARRNKMLLIGGVAVLVGYLFLRKH